MRRLMLLRHAKTENDAPAGRDQDRRLDDRGRLDAAEIGGWLARHPPFPGCRAGFDRGPGAPDLGNRRAAMKDLVPEPQVEFAANSTAPIRRNCCRPSAMRRRRIRSG